MLKVCLVGAGPLGQRMATLIAARPDLKLAAVVDIDEAKQGRDIGELAGGQPLGIRVSPDLATALQRRKADVAVLTTVSSVTKLVPQIAQLAQHHLSIVSTCEELAYPWIAHPRAARRIDRLCRQHNVACLGTGVNPGFLMDYLPVVLTAPCQEVKKITVTRCQDASIRRIPFQQKIGAGLSRTEFSAQVKAGTLRHVGLTESIHMIAAALNWKLDRTTESLKGLYARTPVDSGYRPIPRGRAIGVEQIGRGYRNDKEIIRLHFRAAVGEAESYDAIDIRGRPNLSMKLDGGVDGDIATCAVTVNALRSIMRCGPGLNTMLDLPVPGFR